MVLCVCARRICLWFYVFALDGYVRYMNNHYFHLWIMAKWMVHDLWQSGWFKIYGKVDGSRFMKEWMVQKNGGAKEKSPHFPSPPPLAGGGGGRGGAFFLRPPIFLNRPLFHKS